MFLLLYFEYILNIFLYKRSRSPTYAFIFCVCVMAGWWPNFRVETICQIN